MAKPTSPTQPQATVAKRAASNDLTSAHAALQAENRRYAALLGGAFHGIIVHRKGKLLYVNDALPGMFGYRSRREVLALKSIYPMIAPQHRKPIRERIRRRMAGKRVPQHFDLEGLRKDGSSIWLDGRARVIDWDGGPAIQLSLADVTGRKLAEDALRESEERFRSLAEGSIEAIMLHVDFVPQYVNPAFVKMFGLRSADQALGMDLRKMPYIHPSSRKEVLRHARARRAGRPAPSRYEFRGLRLDGSDLWVEVQASRIKWGRQDALLGTYNDITESRRAKLALQASEEKYRQLIEGSIQGIMIHLLTRVLFVNPALARMFGYTPEEMLALRDVGQLLAPDERSKRRASYRRRTAGEPVPERYEVQCVRKDGTRFWMEAFSRVIVWDGRTAVQTVWVDITEQKKANEEAREAAFRLQTLVTHAPVIFFSLDGKGIITTSDGSGLRPLQMQPGELVGRSIFDVVQGHDEIADDARRALRGEAVASVRKFGGFYFENRYAPVIGEDGQVTSVIGLSTDITDRMQAQAEVRREAQRFRDLTEGSIQGVYVHRDFRVLFANLAFARLLGYDSPDELIGFDILSVIPTELHERHRKRYRRRLAGKEDSRQHIESPWVRRDGSIVWTLVAARPVTWDGAPAAQVAVIDISQRMHAEAQLRQSEERYRDLVEGSIQGILVHADFKPRFANAAFARIFGFESPEQVLQAENVLNAVHPSERARIESSYVRRMRGESVPSRIRFQGLRPDGRPLWVECASGLITWDGVPAIQATFNDITEQRELERQLQQSQKMEALGQLSGGIAHDFNNLLQVIGGYAELITGELARDEKNQRSLSQIRRAVERGSQLTRHLLALSRRQVLSLRPIRLNELILELADMIRRLIGGSIELELAVDSSIAQVQGDAGAIEQVLINLCINARDAMAQGGTIRISTQDLTLDEAFCRVHAWAEPGEYVRVDVADNGMGIDPEIRDHIFEPFFTTKDKSKGSGLGLAIVYGIVHQHGGLLELNSELGKGTTFSLYFLQLEALPREVREGPAADPIRPTGRILVAEDDRSIRKLVSETLMSNGYRVLVAGDGQEALELLAAHPDEVDLAVLDLAMPGLGGRAVYESMQSRAAGVPVIFVSGFSPEASDLTFIDRQGVTLLTKPFTRKDLLHAVDAHLLRPG